MSNYTDLYNQIHSYLHQNENVLWVGKPTSNKLSSRASFSAFFALFFMGFSIFWMIMAYNIDGFFFLFGIPFFVVGLVLLYKTTIGQKKGLNNSIYAVTETRAIIVVTLPRKGTTCKEYIFSNLETITLENVNNNVGTIRFEDVNVYHYGYGNYNRHRNVSYYPEREFTTAFVMIDDVHTVYHLISERIQK